MKIHSPQITHKTEVGGVVLNLTSDDAVSEAFDRITVAAAEKRPDAQISGVTVQKMIAYPNGFELILGTKKDPVFGAVIMVGMGGVAAEVLRDRALAMPPLNASLARQALGSLRCWPLLKGYGGRPGVNIDRLIETLLRFSYLVADYPEIRELDVNPLLCTPDDVIALDVRIVVDRDLIGRDVRPTPTWRSVPIRMNSLRGENSRTVRRSSSVRSSRKTSRCGTTFLPVARRRPSGSASATSSNRAPTKWPRGTVSSTMIARWALSPKSRRKAIEN